MARKLSRRDFLKASGTGVAASVFGPYVIRRPGANVRRQAIVNTLGVALPEDAAPLEMQNLYMHDPVTNILTFDWFRSNYRLGPGNLFIQEPLVRVDQDLLPLPAGAESWSVSEDHLTWTFNIRRGLEWSDGKPYTAHDWVYSFRLGANPETGYDFAWYYGMAIKNWNACNAGEVPLEELGVAAPDDYTLQITTDVPRPWVPNWVGFAMPGPMQAEEQYGPDWSLDPATFVSSGPYMLGDFVMDQRAVFVINPNYKGDPKPMLERIEFNPVAQGLMIPSYLQGRPNLVGQNWPLEAPDVETALADPTLADQLHPYGHFQTYYVGMNTYEAPFDNLKLRQAITHAIDRDTLANAVLPNQVMPAYTMLMKGFPGEHVDQLKDYQKYDPELAKELIAEAGYPNGEGLPPLEMWVRGTGAQVPAIYLTGAEAVAAMLAQNLGLNIAVRPTEIKTFNDELNSHRLPFYFIPYQFDFLDASNMLGIWRSTGRHAWQSEKFEDLIDQADAEFDDQEKRGDLFYQAEQTLLEDAPAAFVFHPLLYHMWKPYVVGADLEQNAAGFQAVVYLNTSFHRTVYINNLIEQGL